MSRTKEPWVYQEIAPDDKDWGACEIQGEVDFVATMVLGVDNARRIVACVNACAGIQIEHLEEVQGEFGKAFLDAKERAVNYKQQRDELFKALKGIQDTMGFDWLLPEFDEARNAIAKVESAK